mmetsp:Transcript_33183/g.53893  ORF Transcript_33183/g.53893 Transcript_33183/m.53893 type:complete len:516 (+) Transcript_33183:68-1615(+)
MDDENKKGASKGDDTTLYRWVQSKEEIYIRIKPPLHPDKGVKLHDKVIIHGLKKAPKFNWKHGEVCREIKDGRIGVRCDETLKEVNVRPQNLCTKPRRDDVKVEFKSKELKVTIGETLVIDGKLKDLVLTDECTWYFSDGLPELLLTKQKHEWWSGVIEGDPEIDVDLAEGETFLDEKMMDRLKSKKAKERMDEIQSSKRPMSLDQLKEFYECQLSREKELFTKKRDSRAFALWTRKAREMAGLSLDYSSIGSVCSPIRCVEKQSKCSLRSKIDPEEMDNLHTESQKEVDAQHKEYIRGLETRLEIIKRGQEGPAGESVGERKDGRSLGVKPLSTEVSQSALLPASREKVWRLVMPVTKIAGPGRVVLSTCRSDHKVGMTFKIKTKAKITEKYVLRTLSNTEYKYTYELLSRSEPIEASVTHSVQLKPVVCLQPEIENHPSSTTDSSDEENCELIIESSFNKGASSALLAQSNIDKLDFFDLVRRKLRKDKVAEKVQMSKMNSRGDSAENDDVKT